MAQKYTRPSSAKASSTDHQLVNFIYDKSNYRLLVISVAIVALGFVLMAGTTDIYSSTKIILAPIVVLAGFGLGFVALLKKPGTKA